jgi:ubiquinone/menaquinone biosynthesis C-methylase UbiE
MSPEQPSNKTTYPIDPESGAEMARLMFQERLFNENMGGTLIEQDPEFVKNLKDVVDLACGPGGWILNLAYELPDTNIVGIDLSQSMTDYARAQAWSQGLNNTKFQSGNILESLPFDDHSFDLVNARFIEGFVSKSKWPALIDECIRITRPGGIIRITEADNYGVTNSPAFQKITDFVLQGQHQLGNAFSADGHSSGLIPACGSFLIKAGCTEVTRKAHILDFSAPMSIHDAYTKNVLAAFRLGGKMMSKLVSLSEEEWLKLVDQMEIEMMGDDFCGVLIYVTTWGKVPAKPEQTNQQTTNA